MNTVPETPPQIPDHDLVRRIGQGSYGEVWLARNVMGTFRAIKLVRRESFKDERPYEREFSGIQKFEPISRTHPGLVTILHVGRNAGAGYFYYIMEIADDARTGQTIEPDSYAPRTLASEISHRSRLPVAECIDVILPLAEALSHLHQRGLIHRDIKPSNIIFVLGAPKFADIGLVTDIGEKATMVGTEGYIPPEGPGTAAADVFSLGKVLYQISTGKAPEQFPELPTALREFVDAAEFMGLNAVALKACESRAEHRFQTADQLKSALIDVQSRGRRPTGSTILTAGQSNLAASQLRVVVLGPASKDTEPQFFQGIGDELARRGCDIFMDDRAALTVEWAREIEIRIENADAVVVVLTPESYRSPCLAYAIEVTYRRSRQHKDAPRLFAVELQSRTPLPKQFEIALSEAKHFSAFGADTYERAITELGAAVEGVVCLKETQLSR